MENMKHFLTKSLLQKSFTALALSLAEITFVEIPGKKAHSQTNPAEDNIYNYICIIVRTKWGREYLVLHWRLRQRTCGHKPMGTKSIDITSFFFLVHHDHQQFMIQENKNLKYNSIILYFVRKTLYWMHFCFYFQSTLLHIDDEVIIQKTHMSHSKSLFDFKKKTYY